MSSELNERAVKAQQILNDKTIPPWKRLHESLSVYSGLNLTALSKKMRSRVEAAFLKVYRIISKYDIKEIDDYKNMSEHDLLDAVDYISNLSGYILRDVHGA